MTEDRSRLRVVRPPPAPSISNATEPRFTASFSSIQRTSFHVGVGSSPTEITVSPLAIPAIAAGVFAAGSPSTGFNPGRPATKSAQ